MFSKFKLNATRNIEHYLNNYYDAGLTQKSDDNSIIKKKIQKHIDYNSGIIDGNGLERELFNEIDADIFLSHSHNDEKLVVSIAGWLKEEMNLKAFIDSAVWDYVNDILSEINNRYNVIKKLEDGTNVYNYTKVNYVASHLYLMLNSALNNMINKTECLFFINTPNSVFLMNNDEMEGQTLSPWIYSELVMANTMRKTEPQRYTVLEKSMTYNFKSNEKVIIAHNLDFSDFINIDMTILDIWQKEKNANEHSLDTLYKIVSQGTYVDKDKV